MTSTDTTGVPDDVADDLVATVRRWVDAEVIPHASELEHADEFPQAMFEQMDAFGLFGATISPDYGGLGLSATVYARIIEELARGWMTLSGILNTHKIAATMIARYGTEEQKQRFLPAHGLTGPTGPPSACPSPTAAATPARSGAGPGATGTSGWWTAPRCGSRTACGPRS